jgi:transglutaminase-like putative cysteine protease
VQRGAVALLVAVALLSMGCQRREGAPNSTGPSSSVKGPGGSRQNLHRLTLPVPRTEDLSHADPAHFAAALGNEPARIFEFVRDSIAYEVYAGLLRGPRGTLLAAAGNAVDRSALLASILERAGQRVRFARGTLERDRARSLVLSMWAARDEPPQTTPEQPAAEIKAIAEILPVAARRDFSLIQGQMKALGIQPQASAAPSLESLTEEARQHYWVQWFKDGTWVDVDPSFSDARPGQTYAKTDEVLAALPASLAHQVRVRVMVEEYTGSTTATREILTYSANAADLSAADLLFVHVPENWSGPAASIESAIAGAVAATGRAKPVLLAGAQHVSGEPILLKMATGGLGSVGRLLGGEGTRRKTPLAVAEFLEVDFIDPSGRKETVRRDIFDAVGAARRAAGQALTADELKQLDSEHILDSVHSLFFTTGRLDAGHVPSTPSTAAPSPADATPIDVRALLRRLQVAFAVVSDGLNDRVGTPDRAVILFYPDSARLTIVDVALAGESLRLRIDLRRDRARAVAMGPKPETVVLARIQRGVVQGTLERLLLTYAVPSTGQAARVGLSTSVLFEAAQAGGLSAVALPRDRARLGAVPADARARLDAEIARGYVAIAPERALSINGVQRYAWWRIEPASGETTAVIDDGLHAYEAVANHDRNTKQVLSIELFYVGTQRVLLGTLNQGSFRRLGGIDAVYRLLRSLHYNILYRGLY